jgi:hypothetical protein
MLRYLEGSGSTEAREKGFSDRIKEAGLTLADSAYTKGGGSTTDAADNPPTRCSGGSRKTTRSRSTASSRPTNRPRSACCERSSSSRPAGMKIDCPFVGFDAHEVLLAGIRDGKVAAIVTQDPKKMGYLGVQSMLEHLNGETDREDDRHDDGNGHEGEHRQTRDQGGDAGTVEPETGMTNDQIQMTNEVPMTNTQLGFGAWAFIGHSGLGFGHF